METAIDIPAWIAENLKMGFRLGNHKDHITSYEPDVAVVPVTGEAVHYCHTCEDFVLNSEILCI